MTVFYADSGRVAIYTGSTDEALEQDPTLDIGRIKFHSDLPYAEIVSVVTGSIALPLGNTSWYPGIQGKKVALFSHGLAYTPLFFGQMTGVKFQNVRYGVPITYLDVSMSGSVPIGTGWENGYIGGQPRFQNGREISFGADANDVFLWDQPISKYWATPSNYNQFVDHQPLPVTLNYVVYVTDVSL